MLVLLVERGSIPPEADGPLLAGQGAFWMHIPKDIPQHTARKSAHKGALYVPTGGTLPNSL
jgi:hypothetical protein